MNSDDETKNKGPEDCPRCGSSISSSDERCRGCDAELKGITSQNKDEPVKESNRIAYASVVSEDGKEVTHELEHGKTVDCPECGFATSIKEKECPECGENIQEAVNQLILEEMLMNVDDTTFELKDTDKESIISNIRKFASLIDEPQDDYEVEIKFVCPLCGAEVFEDSDTCPGCGAIFED